MIVLSLYLPGTWDLASFPEPVSSYFRSATGHMYFSSIQGHFDRTISLAKSDVMRTSSCLFVELLLSDFQLWLLYCLFTSINRSLFVIQHKKDGYPSSDIHGKQTWRIFCRAELADDNYQRRTIYANLDDTNLDPQRTSIVFNDFGTDGPDYFWHHHKPSGTTGNVCDTSTTGNPFSTSWSSSLHFPWSPSPFWTDCPPDTLQNIYPGKQWAKPLYWRDPLHGHSQKQRPGELLLWIIRQLGVVLPNSGLLAPFLWSPTCTWKQSF